jgi:hypothetical protein
MFYEVDEGLGYVVEDAHNSSLFNPFASASPEPVSAPIEAPSTNPPSTETGPF